MRKGTRIQDAGSDGKTEGTQQAALACSFSRYIRRRILFVCIFNHLRKRYTTGGAQGMGRGAGTGGVGSWKEWHDSLPWGSGPASQKDQPKPTVRLRPGRFRPDPWMR